MSKRGALECVLKTGLAKAIKKDQGWVQATSGVENGHHVTKWLKEVAKDFAELSPPAPPNEHTN